MRIDRYLAPPASANAPAPPRALWALAFRPFFLGAAVLAAIWLPLWLAAALGGASLPLALPAVDWHVHELVFGFAGAVLVGFLLTAARNWTNRPTASGPTLFALFALWAAGRLALLLGASLPPALTALLGLAYLPVAALLLARPLLAAGNRRNYAFPALLLVLFGAGVAFSLASPAGRRVFTAVAVDVVVLFLVAMGGRVIPFFTRNRLRDVAPRVRSIRALDWLSTLSVAALAIAHLTAVQSLIDPLAIAAGAANLARVLLWRPWLTARVPLLWVLHLGYAWIGLSLVLMGLGAFAPALGAGGAAPIHGLTVGALGLLSLGMMARVSLGHTGRPLEAARLTVLAFVLMAVAGLLRVAVPLVAPDAWSAAIAVSGSLFSAAWLLFLIVYTPILTRPRADGAPG